MKTQLRTNKHINNFKLKLLLIILLAFASNPTKALLSSYGLTTTTATLDAMSGGTITTLVNINTNDGASGVTPIGFSFAFNGTTYTSFSVNSNGNMRLGATAIATTATNSITGGTDFPRISPYWDDLKTVAGTVRSKVLGSAPSRTLVVDWNVTVVNTNQAIQFQTWLFEGSNKIQFVYGAGINANPGLYSIGLTTSSTDYSSITVAATFASSTASTVAANNSNNAAIGASNSFLYMPSLSCPVISSPANLATNVLLDAVLSWSAGAGATPTGYNVYFGTATNPPLVSSNQASLTYNPGFLSANTTYFWKVIALDGSGQSVGCTENQFTTRQGLAYEVTRSTGITYSSIAGTGSTVSSWRNGTDTDDNLSNAVSIGFNFVYDGVTYTSFLIGVNGFITFNTSTPTIGNAGNPYGYLNSGLSFGTPASPKLLAPFYDDITCQGGRSNLQINLDNCIKYKTTGSVGSRILTVEWIGMETYNTGGPNLNFQVKLYEGSNKIDFDYGSMDGFDGTVNNPYSYSLGINATSISSTGQPGEYLEQQIANTRNFAGTVQNQLYAVPECNSRITFTPGTYTPYVPVSQVPPNDSIGNPIHLSVNPTPCIELCGVMYKSAFATPSPKTVACGGTADDDVWFDFTANNANTTIKVSGSGNYDPTVELFNSSLVSIACANTVGQGLSETINSTTLVPGNLYYVRVYHRGAGYGTPGSGEFAICVSGTPTPPANDHCLNAISLPISATLTPGTNTYAATLSTAPSCGLGGGENPDDDVWYKFVAPKAIEVITVSGGVGFNAVIQLLNGTCGSLNSISCKNSFGNGQVETLTATGLTIGGTYYIRVYHAGIGGGSGNFSISVSSPAPECSDLTLPPDAEINMSASGIDLIWDPILGADNYKVKFDTVNPPVRVLGTTTDTTLFTGVLQPDRTYYWQLIPGNGNSYNNGCPVTSFATEERPIGLSVKVFLQELYLTNRTMKTVLNPADTIADTLIIDLYDDLAELQYTSYALLSTSGLATGYFPLLALDSPYYFVVRHRNSLETWSSTQFMLTGDTLFDFSSNPADVWGGNVVQVEPGVYAMYCGDVNQDGYINNVDVGLVGDSAALFTQGYNNCDINADSTVESLDLSIIENLAPRSKKTPFPPFGP